MAAGLCMLPASAQLSTHPDKFLGNITTDWPGSMDYDGLKYSDYWNQVTPENGTKWGTVEGTRGSYYWDGADPAFNYAKNHGFPFKFHTLIWGSQFPNWFKALSLSERYNAILNWMDVVKKKYPNLHMIDVANEAVEGHQDDTPVIKAALGGAGKTGYDWLVKAFEMAYERWPDAILIYNDFNTFTWQIDEYIELVRTLRDAGAPIDAYGNQAHDLGGKSTSELQSVMKKQQDALKMPMFISEYDIQDANDANQKWNYQQHIPLMWEADYCAGVTLWGWIYGKTWMQNLSGLIKDKKERSALTWLREYMQTDAAKNAKSPYPGMKKEASIYIRPAALKVAKGDVLPVKIHARLATKTIEKVDFYVNDNLVKTMTEAPYVVEYIANSPNWNTMKAVVTATDGTTYERYGRFLVTLGTKRSPYNDTAIEIPGTIKASEFDRGLAGVVASSTTRSYPMSVQDGQWMEYTVDVKEDGYYSFDAEVAAANANGRFHLAEYSLDSLSFLTEFVEVPKTGGTSEFKMLHGRMLIPLTVGRHVVSLMIDKGDFKIKSISLNRYEEGQGTCMVKNYSQEYGVGDNIKLEGMFIAKNSTIKEVRFYANGLYVGTATESPYAVNFVPLEMGTYAITAIVVNAEGKEKESKARELKVTSPTPTDIQTIVNNNAMDVPDAPAYNLMGVPVNSGYRGIVIKNGKKIFVK